MVWPAIIAGGAALIGGAISAKSASDANQSMTNLDRKNRKMQKQFAQQGIRWKVEDAKQAGIHPLAALGASTTSYSPQKVGIKSKGDYGISRAGQNIGRAMSAQKTFTEKAQDLANLKLIQAETVGKNLANMVTAKQIKETQQETSMPGESNLPSDYLTYDKLLKARGVNRETTPTKTRTGTIRHYPSQEIMDLISESAMAAGLFYKGSLNYATAMNAAHKMKGAKRYNNKIFRAYQSEKNKLTFQMGQPVEWARTSGNTGSWVIKGTSY